MKKITEFSGKHFILRENSILLENGSLPSCETVQRCFAHDVVCDWFLESEVVEPSYCSDSSVNSCAENPAAEGKILFSALLLENDAPNPKGCEDIPLREFYARVKNCGGDDEDVYLASRAKALFSFKKTMKYCSCCGEKLVDDKATTSRTCPKCSHQFFPRIEPAVIVLVSKGDEILLARNASNKTGFYGCIAGFIESGETAEHCVQREVMEETGIKVKNIRYAGTQSWPFPDQLMLAFHAEYESGKIQIQRSELLDANWFKKDNLPSIPPEGSVAHNLIFGKI